VNKQASGPII